MLVKRVFLLDIEFAMTILDIVSRVYLPSFVIIPLKYLKYFTPSSFFIFFIYPRKIIYTNLDEVPESVLLECLRFEDLGISFWKRHLKTTL